MTLRLMATFLILGLLTCSVRSSAEESADEIAELFRQLMVGTEVSCETMFVSDYAGDDLHTRAHSKAVNFDKDSCTKRLKAKTLAAYVGSFFGSLAEGARFDPPSTPPFSDQPAPGLKFYRELAFAFRSRMLPLIRLCQGVQPIALKSANRSCYFGAPQDGAGKAAVAAFKAFTQNSLPRSEAVCASEVDKQNAIAEPEFQGFPRNADKLVDWKIVKQELTADGFRCKTGGAEGEETCTKSILEIVLPSSGAARQWNDESEGTCFFGEEAIITIKEIEVYRGSWSYLGIPASCLDQSGDKKCIRQPQRGASRGVCMMPDNALASGMLMYYLNGCF